MDFISELSEALQSSEALVAQPRPVGNDALQNRIVNGWQNTNTGAGRQYNALSMSFSKFSRHHSPPEDAHNTDVGQQPGVAAHEAESKSFYRDLFTTDPFEDRENLEIKQGSCAEGTCEWILETEELNAWLKPEPGRSPVLWLSGTPGKGKSALAIYLTKVLATIFSQEQGGTCAYFFCDSISAERNTAQSILRGLLWQILQDHPELLNDKVRQTYDTRGKKGFESFIALWGMLKDVASGSNHHIFCIIDALDECEEMSRDSLLKKIQQDLGYSNPTARLSLLILSRPYHNIRQYLSQVPHRELESFPESKQDVERYIDQQLRDLSHRRSYSSSTAEKVKQILQEKAEGTFLWVGIACEELRRLQSIDAITLLKTLPKGLQSLYATIYSAMIDQTKDNPTIGKRLLATVVTSLRPLTLLELSDACQLDQDEDKETRMQYMRDRVVEYRSMILLTNFKENSKYDDEKARQWENITDSERVIILHESVKDFLFTSLADQFFNEPSLHASLAYRCLDELLWHLPKRGEDARSSGYFLSYAIQHWPQHARMAGDEFEVRNPHHEFFAVHSDCREAWLDRWDSFSKNGWTIWTSRGCKLPVLNIAALWQLPALIDYVSSGRQKVGSSLGIRESGFFERGFEQDEDDEIISNAKSPLVDAIQSGNVHILKRLLKIGLPLTSLTIEAAATYSEMIQVILNDRKEEIMLDKKLSYFAASELSAEMLEIILNHPKFEMNDEIFNGGLRNKEHGIEVMRLLFQRFGDKLTLDETRMQFAAANCCHLIMDFLLVERGTHIQMTPEIAAATVENCCGPNIMRVFLKHRPHEISITEDFMVLAMEKNYAREFADLFIELQVNITKDALMAFICDADGIDDESFESLLIKLGADVEIDEDIVVAAITNFGNWGLQTLFEHRGDDIKTTPRVLMAAADSWRYNGFRMYLERLEGEPEVSQETLRAEAENDWNGPRLMLQVVRSLVGVTPPMITAAWFTIITKWVETLLTSRRRRTTYELPEVLHKKAVEYLLRLVLIEARRLGVNVPEFPM